MTEDEARTKWCPQRGRVGGPPQRALSPGQTCIGSACMAWRPRTDGSRIQAIRAHRATHGSSLVEAKGAVDAGWVEPPTEGYCGLAGAPQ